MVWGRIILWNCVNPEVWTWFGHHLSFDLKTTYICFCDHPDQKLPLRMFWNLCKVPIYPISSKNPCSFLSSVFLLQHVHYQMIFFLQKKLEWQSCSKARVSPFCKNTDMANIAVHLSFHYCNFDVSSTLLDWYSGVFKCGPKFIYNWNVGYIWIYLKVYLICIWNPSLVPPSFDSC